MGEAAMTWQQLWQDQRYRYLSIAIVFVMVLLVGVVMFWRPIWQQWPSASEQAQLQQQRQIAKIQYVKLLKQKQQLDQRLPSVRQQHSVISWLSAQLQLSGLKINAWAPSAVDMSKRMALHKITIKLDCQGHYHALLGWLSRVQSTLLIKLNQLVIQASTDHQVTAQLQITVFLQNSTSPKDWKPAVSKHQSKSLAGQNPFFPNLSNLVDKSLAAPEDLTQYHTDKIKFLGQMFIGTHCYGLVSLPDHHLVSVQKGSVLGKRDWHVVRIIQQYIELKDVVGQIRKLTT